MWVGGCVCVVNQMLVTRKFELTALLLSELL